LQPSIAGKEKAEPIDSSFHSSSFFSVRSFRRPGPLSLLIDTGALVAIRTTLQPLMTKKEEIKSKKERKDKIASLIEVKI